MALKDEKMNLFEEMSRLMQAQNTSRKLGSAMMAEKVLEWAIKHATSLPTEAIVELRDIVSKEPQ